MKKDFRSISQMYRDIQEAAIPKKAEKAVEKSLEKIDDPVEKLEALDGMVKKALGESEAYYAMKRAEKHAAKDGHDFHKLPEYDRGKDKPHKEKYRAMAKSESYNEGVANTATLEYGTQLARDTYAKDTPGQSQGEPTHEPTHAMKAKYGLSVNGVPDKGGSMSKPDFSTTTGIKVEGNDTEAELVEKMMTLKDIDDGKPATKKNTPTFKINPDGSPKKKEQKEAKETCSCDCDCGKKICESCGKPKKLDEISNELVKKVSHERNVNVSMAGSKADYDRRDPEYQKAAKKQDRNRKLRFSRGATAIGKMRNESMSVTLRKSKSQPGSYKVHSVGSAMKSHGGMKPGERVKDHHIDDLHDSGIKVKYHKEMTEHQKSLIEAKYTDKQVRMAKGIAFDKRHVGGDYTGAAKKMEKIKKGLSDHPKAADALRRANEQKEFAKELFATEGLGDMVKKGIDKVKKVRKDIKNFHKTDAAAAIRKDGYMIAKRDTKEAVERRADTKVIMSTDAQTGKKVAKKAPRKEIEIGLGKDA